MRAFVASVALALVVAACAPAASTPSVASAPVATAPAAASPATGADPLGERTNEGAGIEVRAAWVSADPPSLLISMNTHSIDLDKYDLATLARLRIDGGGWIAPTAVDMPKGGHHREGEVRFATATATFGAARVIELEIVDVMVPSRTFRWDRGA